MTAQQRIEELKAKRRAELAAEAKAAADAREYDRQVAEQAFDADLHRVLTALDAAWLTEFRDGPHTGEWEDYDGIRHRLAKFQISGHRNFFLHLVKHEHWIAGPEPWRDAQSNPHGSLADVLLASEGETVPF